MYLSYMLKNGYHVLMKCSLYIKYQSIFIIADYLKKVPMAFIQSSSIIHKIEVESPQKWENP